MAVRGSINNCCTTNFQSLNHLAVNRRQTKWLVIIVKLLALLWLIGFMLFQVTKFSFFTKIDSKESDKMNGFNSRKPLVPELNVDDFYYSKEYEVLAKSQNNNGKLHRRKLSSLHFDHSPFFPRPDCPNILKGDQEVVEQTSLLRLELKSQKYAKVRAKMMKMDEFLNKMAENCTEFLSKRKYIRASLTPEEESFPIAYIITIHNRFSEFETLLRSIYHPQNIYCVHVDKKSPDEFKNYVQKLIRCLDNVFLASKLTEVHYSHWSRVQADINCMEDLVRKATQVQWKYVINLCGQDFPLKTNLEIIRSLKSLHGYNNLETFVVPEHKKRRYEFVYVLPSSGKGNHAVMEKTNEKKSPSPLETPMFAGSAYYAWKREAVEYMLKDPTIQKFFIWNQDSYSPDEHMWATLQRFYPNVPGSFPTHIKYDLNELQSITRLVKWAGLDSSVYPKCSGQFVRGVCVYGAGDLSWLLQQHHLFANKFDPDIDPFAIQCLEIFIRNRTIRQTSVYLSKGFV